MLTITKEHVTVGLRKNGQLLRPAINSAIEKDIVRMLGEITGSDRPE
jgi:hypothetical protein